MCRTITPTIRTLFRFIFLPIIFRYELCTHKWYIDEKELLVVVGVPLRKFKIVDIRKRMRKIKANRCLFWEFDYGKILLSNEKMDFSTSDAATFLHTDWDVLANNVPACESTYFFIFLIFW